MRKIVSIISAAAVAMPIAVVVPVATALSIAVAVPDSASASHRGRDRFANPFQNMPRLDIQCVQDKLNEGQTADQAYGGCYY